MEKTKYPLHLRHIYLGEANCREISHDDDLYIFEDETEEFILLKLLSDEEKEYWLNSHLQVYKAVYEDNFPYLPAPIIIEETTTGRFFADLQISMADYNGAKRISDSMMKMRKSLYGKAYEEAVVRDAVIRLPILREEEKRNSLIPVSKNHASETEWNLEMLCTYFSKNQLEKWYGGDLSDASEWLKNINHDVLLESIRKYDEPKYRSMREKAEREH